MVEIRYYVSVDGREPFAEWFAELDPIASAKIARAMARMEQGNFSNVKSVGEGVLEHKIDFGLPDLFRKGWRHDRDPADGRDKEAAAAGH